MENTQNITAPWDIVREILIDDRGGKGINVRVNGWHIGSYTGEIDPSNSIEINARLIAALPTLKKTCEYACEFMEAILQNDTLTEHEKAVYDLASAAINQMKGNL